MSSILPLFLVIVVFVAACAPTPTVSAPPTAIPFPTVTPGRVLRGSLPTPAVVRQPDDPLLANPATAVALASRPTATPNYGECPPVASPTLEDRPATGRAMAEAMARFLSAGGAPATLESRLRSAWDVLGDDGVVRADTDLTGEGAPEVLVTFMTPDDGGVLLILGCANRRYANDYSYTSDGGEIPRLLNLGDMTFDGRPEVLFAVRECSGDDGQTCVYRTQLVGWRGDLGRFVSLLADSITSDDPPTVSDVDNDQISEIVVRQENPGTAQTGPLRTGVSIYDWNGAVYVESLNQLDPPRFRIQVVQQADRAFVDLNAAEALSLYELALESPELDRWHNDEGPILESYLLFKLLVAQSYIEAPERLDTHQRIMDTFPDPLAAPVYVEMSIAFWEALQVTNNLSAACSEAREIIAERPEALDLLNRYGERSPVYSETVICPF